MSENPKNSEILAEHWKKPVKEEDIFEVFQVGMETDGFLITGMEMRVSVDSPETISISGIVMEVSTDLHTQFRETCEKLNCIVERLSIEHSSNTEQIWVENRAIPREGARQTTFQAVLRMFDF